VGGSRIEPMAKPTSTSRTGVAEHFVVRSLRTGKIYATQSSASEIRRSVGVRPSEAKVAAKALRIALSATKSPKEPISKTASRPKLTPPSHPGSRPTSEEVPGVPR
jgi:hypothetical protein